MNRKVGVVYSCMLMFVEVFTATLFTPFLIRSLGQSEYGVYQLVSSITSYLMLFDLGINTAAIRYISKFRTEGNREKQQEFMGIIAVFYLLISALVLLIGVVMYVIFPTVFAKGLSVEEINIGRKLLVLTILSTAVTLSCTTFSATLLAYERFSFLKGFLILTTVSRVVIAAIALKFGARSFSVVLIYFLANIATRLAYALYVLLKLKLRPLIKKPDFSFLKETISYSSFVLLQMIATHINAMTDSTLLGILAKDSAVIIAVYGAGAQIVQYFRTIGEHFNGVLMPGIVRMVETGATAKQLQNEMVRIGRIILMMLGLVFTVYLVNGQQFMILWAGEDYKLGYFVAASIMAPTMFKLIQSVGNQTLLALSKHKVQAVVQIISALINIVLSIFLIRWKPLEGAVIGSVIALAVGNVILPNILFIKEIGINLIEYYRELLKGLLPSFIISAAAGMLFNLIGLSVYGWLGFIVNCMVMVAVYVVCMLLFGMNGSEKNMIFGICKKVLSKAHLIKGE